tara:strand:+ start:106 stop:717 length:612 start_codon:yes stop_codon:yes gene_type:complete
MTEKLNTSNISILQTNTAEEIGIRSIATGVKDNVIAKTLIEQASTDPNKVTKSTVSILESIMNCKITEQTNSQYVFARWQMPTISECAYQLKANKPAVMKALRECMTVADPKDIHQWLIEVMVCTAKQSHLTQKDLAFKAKVYAKKFEHVPADIMKYACEKVIMNCKFFPTVAEFYEFIEPMLYYRKSLVEAVSSKLITAIGE